MPTLDEIYAEINALPHRYVFYTRKEIRYLPKLLNAGEHILALTSGYINTSTWLIVCTNHRVLFLHRGMIYGLHQVQMNLDRIQSIDSRSGLVFGTIRMWDGASSMHVNLILKQSVAPFVRTVQEAMDRYKRELVSDIASAAMQSKNHTNAPTDNFIGELERLAKLKAEGHITDDEFAVAKAKLLAQKTGNTQP